MLFIKPLMLLDYAVLSYALFLTCSLNLEILYLAMKRDTYML
jgi:hypothetical protein